MAFWSTQKLARQLPTLFPAGPPPKIDCNAITLTVSEELYVSPIWSDKDTAKKSIEKLSPGECFTIPPGQFGFLQTAEAIQMPRDAMGFISLKATYKLRGLVNVSGFHIDPGFHGTLTFAVFNAGPSAVHLRQGMDLFLVWIASLDEASDDYKKKPVDAEHFLKTVNQVSGPVKSGYDVIGKVEQLEHRIDTNRLILYLIIPFVSTIFIKVVWDAFQPKTAAPPAIVQSIG